MRPLTVDSTASPSPMTTVRRADPSKKNRREDGKSTNVEINERSVVMMRLQCHAYVYTYNCQYMDVGTDLLIALS